METKSRYEVISDLEEKKRNLIREKAALDDESKNKERNILNLKRTKEDMEKQVKDFEFQQENENQKMNRDKKEFDFKMDNTRDVIDRQISDAGVDLADFNKTLEAKKKTVEELIEGVNASLERFGKLQTKS